MSLLKLDNTSIRFGGLVAGLDDVLTTLREHLPPPAGGRA